jgi:hypothetical protein
MRITFKCTNFTTNGNGTYSMYVKPSKESKLKQIPKGPNPRELDKKSKMVKIIKASYAANDNRFGVKNRGIQAAIDDGSLEFDSKSGTISFRCTEKNTGHYDGQHTIYSVDCVLDDNPSIVYDNGVLLTLHEARVFNTLSEIRKAAQAINDCTSQKITSEAHIEGLFDDLKSFIDYTDLSNVGWCQHQLNSKGEKIRAENEAQQLVRLLSTFLPMTYCEGGTTSDVASLPKAGEAKSIGILRQGSSCSSYMEQAFEHVDFVLEFSDHIQNSMARVIGTELSSCDYPIIKKHSGKQLDLPAHQRALFSQHDWRGNEVQGALNKDIVPMFVYAFVRNCFGYNTAKGKFYSKHNISAAKSLWDAHGKSLINIVNADFARAYLDKTSITRRSDFANSPAKYDQLYETLRELMEQPSFAKAA